MTVYLTARFRINDQAVSLVDGAIREFIAQIGENEPGTIRYISLKEKDHPASYLHVFQFEASEAELFHRQTAWVKAFTDILYPETIDGVEFTVYEEVASTDG